MGWKSQWDAIVGIWWSSVWHAQRFRPGLPDTACCWAPRSLCGSKGHHLLANEANIRGGVPLKDLRSSSNRPTRSKPFTKSQSRQTNKLTQTEISESKTDLQQQSGAKTFKRQKFPTLDLSSFHVPISTTIADTPKQVPPQDHHSTSQIC